MRARCEARAGVQCWFENLLGLKEAVDGDGASPNAGASCGRDSQPAPIMPVRAGAAGRVTASHVGIGLDTRARIANA